MDVVNYVIRLIRSSRSQNPYERDEAIQQLRSARVLDDLQALLLSRRVNDRRQAIEFLGYIATPEAIALAVKALNDRSSNVRLDVLDLLGFYEQRWSAKQVVAVMLTDPSSYVRKRAVETLAKFHLPETIPHLLEALEADESSYVRYEAARTLGNFGDRRTALNLAYALINDDNSYVQYAAAQALEKLGDAGMIPALFVGVISENPYVRRAAFKALEAMPQEAARAIREGLHSPEKRERWMTFAAMTVLSEDIRHQLPSWWGVKGAMN